MPSGYLHQRCALDAQKQAGLPGPTVPVRDVFILGAQGPDPLFTLRVYPLLSRQKKCPRLGNIMHGYRTGAFLRALCRRARDSGDIERSFALGFLTHYALDSVVHPYVYAHSYDDKGAYSSQVHMRLEKNWDTLYYRRDGHATGTPMMMPGPEETHAHWPAIAALWQGALSDVYPELDIPEGTIADALSYSARANRLAHSPHGVKYAVASVAERILGKPNLATSFIAPRRCMPGDIANEAHSAWESPYEPGIVRTEGLDELFAAGVRRAAELLSAGTRYFGGDIDIAALGDIIGNAGYGSGIESPYELPQTR